MEVEVDAFLGRFAAVEGLGDLEEVLGMKTEGLQVFDDLLVRPVLQVLPHVHEAVGVHGFSVAGTVLNNARLLVMLRALNHYTIFLPTDSPTVLPFVL